MTDVVNDAGKDPGELLPAWQEFGDVLRAFLSRRVPAADVDDLLQDCYLKVSAGLPTLAEQERLGGWIFRIAHNLAVDHLRRRRHELRDRAEQDVVDSQAGATPDLQFEVGSWLGPMVERLPQKYAEVLRLSEIEGLPHREIAARLGLSVSGVKSRVQRGRGLLRDKLLACCVFEFDRRGRILDYEQNRPGSCDC